MYCFSPQKWKLIVSQLSCQLLLGARSWHSGHCEASSCQRLRLPRQSWATHFIPLCGLPEEPGVDPEGNAEILEHKPCTLRVLPPLPPCVSVHRRRCRRKGRWAGLGIGVWSCCCCSRSPAKPFAFCFCSSP